MHLGVVTQFINFCHLRKSTLGALWMRWGVLGAAREGLNRNKIKCPTACIFQVTWGIYFGSVFLLLTRFLEAVFRRLGAVAPS